MDIKVRQESEKDYKRVEEVIKQAFLNEAFSDQKEHELVNRIRKCDAFIPELSLVAVDKEVVGHVLLSSIKIVDGDTSVDSLALAPISVVQEYQKKEIVSMLISHVLRKAKELGYHSVIVWGHKDYYPKFGFKPANLWNIRAPFDVPGEIFMAMELTVHVLQNVQGVVQYSEAFSE
ncbi:GNAT family N-acetyltransferase [Bacillus sp. C1]